MEWSSWSGAVRCHPRRIERPACEAEIVEGVRRAARAGERLRVVGTGHSSMPLVATDEVLVTLDDDQGVEWHDRAALQATARAGSKLHRLGAELQALGLAMENLGDVDVQSLGGALGTGTHGTGRALGNIASQVVSLRLVLASGELLECSADRDPDLFRAARISLGVLGITSAARLRLLPAYRLHERVWRVPADECLAELEANVAAHRHFEFFWFPRADLCEQKSLNPTQEPAGVPRDGERVGWSADVIPSVRELKFNEMEYAVPAALGPECFGAVRDRMREKHPDVVWPVEYRTLAPDDAWLSPAHERATVTLSVHQDGRRPFREMFADVEAIFRAHGGRPHWGKIHTRGADELCQLYPMWERFRELRRQLDPEGRFLNDYLRGLFEP